jgi:NAD(P)-dependent dehydrogenase (short-subunit alcohol dehydrogenase family)
MSTTTSQPRVALITGASSGIGRVTAIALSKSGWNVVLSGRREAELEETAKQCAQDVKTLCVSGDVSVEENVKALFDKTKEVFGRLDMLFNVSRQMVLFKPPVASVPDALGWSDRTPVSREREFQSKI